MTKLLREKYKTYEGARKRAAFENGTAFSEFKRGYKAHHYHYRVVTDPSGDGFRVERDRRITIVIASQPEQFVK